MRRAQTEHHEPPSPGSRPPQAGRLLRGCLLGGLLLFAFVGALFQVCDADIGYYIRTGAYVIEHHQVPAFNTFSFTAPEAIWYAQQWAPSVLFYGIYQASGVSGLIVFKALLATGFAYLLWGLASSMCGGKTLAVFWLVTVGVMAARPRVLERPDLISAMLLAGMVWAEARWGKDRRWQWAGLPTLFSVWANTHSGVAYGFVVLGAMVLGEWGEWGWRQKRLGAPLFPFKEWWVRPVGFSLALAGAVVSLELINPHGWRILTIPFSAFSNQYWRSIIAEYQPPTMAAAPFFFALVGGLALLQLVAWRHLRLRYFLSALALGYLAWTAQRAIPFFVAVGVPYAVYLWTQLNLNWRSPRWGWVALPAAWAAAVIFLFVPDRTLPFGLGLNRFFYPREIYEFMAQEVASQRMFNEWRFGGSLLWFLYPKFTVFADGRCDAYPEAFWKEEYFPIMNAQPGWQELVRARRVSGALLPMMEADEPPELARQLFADPAWALVAFNDEALLFLERTPANLEVIARNEFRMVWPGAAGLAADQMTNALAEVRRALARSPECWFASAAAVSIFMGTGDYAAAAERLGWMIRQRGARDFHRLEYGRALYKLGRLAEAETVLRRLKRSRDVAAEAWFLRHSIAKDLGRRAEASECLNRALELDPTNAAYSANRKTLVIP